MGTAGRKQVSGQQRLSEGVGGLVQSSGFLNDRRPRPLPVKGVGGISRKRERPSRRFSV
jgi:hypothetical protein